MVGLDAASLTGPSGNIHIPQGSTNFPEDKNESAAPEVRGGLNGCSLGTKTTAARSPLVHAPNAPESQVENGCPKIPCPNKCGRERSQATSSGRRDESSHVSWESRPARKMPRRRRTRWRRSVCMVNHGTLVVPRIAPLGAALRRIKAGGRFLRGVAALHLIVRAPFLGY